MATINGVEVIGDKSAHDFGLLDNQDKTEIDNGIERNREAAEDNHADIVRHRTDTDVHVTPEWKNSLVTKAILGLYWTAAQTADIINEISIAGGAKLVKVDELPETGQEQTIYLVPKTDPKQGDIFDEYVWIDGKFEFIGTTKVDLSNYATKAELNAKANDADVVHKSGDDTIAGVKTFSDGIVSNLLNGKTPETIEEQGDGYIRYSNGLQICWGSAPVAIGTSLIYEGSTTMYYSRINAFNYAKSFSSNPTVILSVSSGDRSPFLQVCGEGQIDKKSTTGTIMLSCKHSVTIQQETFIHIQAIGRWK